MDNRLMVELTSDEAERVHGGHNVAYLDTMGGTYSGVFTLWAGPVYATPIQLPSFS